ncbi:sugar O-acyltransferase (sialic acid O-acetyltransferase NeuD family) [Nonlabens dokdonensis]|jgi:sugar O-acyltransferase (sialic acid O-acetyltransferase NeuD family)|uniref:Transferase hexapeptide repeat protein n=2 Tax=Nonlabens dokdonensis TaxID=328515 RepID=L7WEH0_NONDD|nr:acetyltransferase [Nonlabens dokdonensis]AGC78682.1 transferase hexapeptide repeat protein [Nonlabens dokdonensis DSW-6]PZX39191.1 sugar O-acyltransferase (sialic acid O-acetyltransferase NeuD family) [Nonlabens dokdonensis]
MKKDYYIIGSGGFAKEVYFLADQCLDETNRFKGFIDYKPVNNFVHARGKRLPVIDEDLFLNNVDPNNDINLYFGVGDPKLLNKLSKTFENYLFPNLIHPTVIFDSSSVRFGKGNILTSGCILTVDIQIGSFNIFNLSSTIGHDVNIGDCNIFNPVTNISGQVEIGSNNLFGVNSTVLQLLTVGDNNIVGASSLLTKSIENNSVMVGIPAKNRL